MNVTMSNIFDYLQWRGDLKITADSFNEIDSLILSRFSYLQFDGLFEEQEEITIKECYERLKKSDKTIKYLWKDDVDLFPALAKSERFGELKISNYINKVDGKQEKQFSAITIIMPDDTIYIAYRGTDNTVIGWKEDFNMSFSELVPSQTDAKLYLENIAKKYNQKIRLGGHSKGGNLAVYAAVFCEPKIQDRIINVYNNDGPGFCDKVVESANYAKMLDKVHTYIPQSSIIGRLLNHKEKITIVKSIQTGIMQHDLYTWQLVGTKFVETELTNSSEFIDETVTNWLKEVNPEQREKFIDIFFEILSTTEVKTFAEFSDNKFSNALTMIKTYRNVDEESKDILIKTLSSFFEVAKNNIKITKPKINLKKQN